MLDLNPHWLSGMFSCAIVGMSLFSKTQGKILPEWRAEWCLDRLNSLIFLPYYVRSTNYWRYCIAGRFHKVYTIVYPRSTKLLVVVKWRKLQWYGHVSCSSGLAKTILQGTVKGGKGGIRQGRQRKRWEDNIREWTGLEFANSQRAVENREKWRTLVVKSSVVPQWPSWLRDRWWWW